MISARVEFIDIFIQQIVGGAPVCQRLLALDIERLTI